MAWQEVETDIGAGIGRPKYSVSLKHGGARISLPKKAVEQLGWSKATRFKLLVGAADQEGRLRLEPSDAGKISGKVAIKGGGLLIRLGRWSGLAPRDVDAVAVDIEIDKSALNITLPRHALIAAPAPRPAPPSPGAGGLATAAKRDVSHQFFNDPKDRAGMQSGTRTGRR